MSDKRAEATLSFEARCTYAEFILGSFEPEYPDNVVRKVAHYVADVLSFKPMTAFRIGIDTKTVEGSSFRVVAGRNALGEYEFRTTTKWVEPASIARSSGLHTFAVDSRWRDGALTVNLLRAIELQAASGLRSWVFGETTVTAEDVSLLYSELHDFANEASGATEIWFPVSSEAVKWRGDDNDSLIERMALEIGALLGRPVKVHRSWMRRRPSKSASDIGGSYRRAVQSSKTKRTRSEQQERHELLGRLAGLIAGLAGEGSSAVSERSDRTDRPDRTSVTGVRRSRAKASKDQARTSAMARHFSSASSGSSFSLRDAMKSVGIKSIDDLYRRFEGAMAEPGKLTRLTRAIAAIPDDDDLGRVLARFMFASSKVETSDSDGINRVEAELELAGIQPPDDEAIARFAVMAVLAGIDEARRSGLGGRCVTALQSIAPIWCNDLPAGEDRLGGTNGRQWVTAAVIVYLAELTASSQLAADMIAESLMGGTAVGKREQIRLAWAYGRSWAEANGIDFDDYVRRSM
jgi:hypothetical protein